MTEKLKEMLQWGVSKIRGSTPEDAVLPQAIIDLLRGDAAQLRKERKLYRSYLRKCVKAASEEYSKLQAQGTASEGGVRAQHAGGDGSYMLADGVGYTQEDWDTYSQSGIKYEFIEWLGDFFDFDSKWPSYYWGELRTALGSPFRLTSLEHRLRRPSRPFQPKKDFKAGIGSLNRVNKLIPYVCTCVTALAVNHVYVYIRYLWYNHGFIDTKVVLVPFDIVHKHMCRDILFWSPPGTPMGLIIPDCARVLELFFFLFLVQYVYYVHLKNRVHMGFKSYRSFMSRGFGDRFATYKELFYSLPADCRILMEVRAKERFEFERDRIKVLYGGMVISDLALAELSDYCRRAVYYSISSEYNPPLEAFREYKCQKIEYGEFLFHCWFVLECVSVGSQVTGVPTVYKYLRDSALDKRDGKYSIKKKIPFVPRIDPEGLKIVHFIARRVCTKNGDGVTEYVNGPSGKLIAHFKFPSGFLDEMRSGYHDDIINKLP